MTTLTAKTIRLKEWDCSVGLSGAVTQSSFGLLQYFSNFFFSSLSQLLCRMSPALSAAQANWSKQVLGTLPFSQAPKFRIFSNISLYYFVLPASVCMGQFIQSRLGEIDMNVFFSQILFPFLLLRTNSSRKLYG